MWTNLIYIFVTKCINSLALPHGSSRMVFDLFKGVIVWRRFHGSSHS